jgi:hypothetical protein
MENILKMLKQLTGTAGMLGTVPKPIRATMTFFAVFVGIFVIFKYAHLDQTEKTFLIIAIVLLALITAGYYGWKAWMEKQHNAQFGGDISQHSSATPRGLSDPGQRARLDDLRKKFQSGVDAYKSRGKDLYKLPWYVIVGEPGSGKTEAIRHSNVGFPPGMQDEFQGVGGTINMNWWFTNHAVLLDTAGRLMFEDLKPGETSEWKEFLSLLKKNRPNCPINGLFLVIPSDSLIKDSADAIQKKAGKIAQQLDVIQRLLDVRFPVFVIVTKCDKINGFREFFDGLTDPQLQHQMMGWSNPDPLDEPFKPDLVDKHLQQVSSRLRRRRLGLLRDPVPENTDGRRTDEVDSLYTLPHSLEMISSRLRRYLETIFVVGEWSAKPLFLRGIYFSSSMREGAALDAELAEAIGVGVDELPEGKVWERERAYFLRDLFTEKVFREKGLVTRATNTKRMLRSQQIALYTSGFLALAVFSVVAWFAMGSLRSGVKVQGDYWHVVSTAGWDNKFWKQSIVPMRGDGSFVSAISTNALTVDNKPVSLGEFHSKLVLLAQQPLKQNLMFPGLATKYNQNSHRAQRIVFEAGVVRPLIEATRQKMIRGEADPGSSLYEPDALVTLIQLESDVLSRGMTPANTGTVNADNARKFIASLQNYIAAQETPIDSNIVSVMVWTYSTNDTAKGSWAPRWLSGGKGVSNSLAINSGLNAGLELFVHDATNRVQTFVSQWNQVASLRNSVAPFSGFEETLFQAARLNVEDKFREAEDAVEKARKDLDDTIAKVSKDPLFASGISLTNARRNFRESVTGSAAGALVRVRDVNNAALVLNKDYPLFKEIKARLDVVQSALSNRVSELIASGDPVEFEKFDDTCLANDAFRKRADLYARSKAIGEENPFNSAKLIGSKGDPLEKFLSDRGGPIRNEAAAYTGKLFNELAATVAYQLKLSEKKQSEKFFDAYLNQASALIGFGAGFPLIRDLGHRITADAFTGAGKQLKSISEDLNSPTFQKYAPRDSSKWKTFVATVADQQMIARALMGDEGTLGACTFSLAASSDATRADDEWQGPWRDLKLIVQGSNSEAIRAGSDADQKIGDAPVAQKLELRLSRNINDPGTPTYSITTAEWGSLELIHKYKGERDKADPKTWLVKVPMAAPGAKGLIRLKLKFENPLPELDKWPVQ